MGQPHKHAALIKAWADGAEIEVKNLSVQGDKWESVGLPFWRDYCDYRIKPIPKVKHWRYAYKRAGFSDIEATNGVYANETDAFIACTVRGVPPEWVQKLIHTETDV